MWASISSPPPPPLLPPHPRSCFPWKHSALVYRRCCYIIPWLQNNKPPSLSALFFMCMSVIRVLPFLHSCVASDAPAIQFLALLISLRPISRRGRGGGGGAVLHNLSFRFCSLPLFLHYSDISNSHQHAVGEEPGAGWAQEPITGQEAIISALSLYLDYFLSHTHIKNTRLYLLVFLLGITLVIN